MLHSIHSRFGALKALYFYQYSFSLSKEHAQAVVSVRLKSGMQYIRYIKCLVYNEKQVDYRSENTASFPARVGGENQLHFSRPHRDWKLKSVNAAVEHFKIAVTF